MANVDLDMSEVRELAVDMTRVDARLTRHLMPVVRKGAVNIKDAMQADLRKSSNKGFQYVASTVSYDELDGGFGAEIGPTKPGGALANISLGRRVVVALCVNRSMLWRMRSRPSLGN